MRKIVAVRVLLLLGMVFLSRSVFADGSGTIFRTFSPEGGFYYDRVTSVAQDGEGFIWVMMDNEIFRFDGYEYKSYSNSLREIDEQLYWSYYGLLTNREGQVFVRTNNGTFRYDRESDTFEAAFRYTTSFTFDGRDNTWVRENNRFALVEADTLFYPKTEDGSYPLTSGISCYYGDEFYLFSNYNMLYRYNYTEREFKSYRILPDNHRVIRQAKVAGDKMWIMVDHYGFYKLDLKTYEVVDYLDLFAGERLNLRSFGIDPSGLLWTGTINGLYVIDPVTREYTIYYHSNEDPFSLPNNSIWTVQEDQHQNIWVGTYAGGLCYINTAESHPFRTFLPRRGGLNQAPVSSFAEDDKYLWIGTEGGGLNRMDKRTGEFGYVRVGGRKDGLAFDNVKSILVDHRGRLWIGMFTGGLDCYDPSEHRITHYTASAGKENSLLLNDLRRLVPEPDRSGFWILYQATRSTISFFSFESGTFTHYVVDPQSSQYIFDMVRGNDDRLWMVSSGHLYRMDVRDKSMEKIELDTTRHPYAQALCTDRRGNVWVGTIGNGLYRYDPKERSCEVIREIGTIGTPSVYSLCTDDEGYLWIGSDKGLFRYAPETGTFLCFDRNDGVQGEVYYPLASFKGRDGKLYFGGTSGFSVVEPRKVAANTYKPNVTISQFYIDNIPTRIRRTKLSRNGERELILSHNEANFGFRFSADNYLIPQKSLFRYRLRGYDDRWILADASSRTAMYSKVPPGTYHFEVVAANNDGVWSDVPTVIRIRRKAAPWFSTTAYVFYGLVVLVILGIIVYHYEGKKKLRLQLYKEGLEKEKKEELHQSQLRFFTNISHDFRTPLSLISAAVDRLREEGIKEYYRQILSSNTDRLLGLVNELMDFRTVETGKMKLKPAFENVKQVVYTLAGDFIEYASQKKIDFRIEIDPALPESLPVDRNVLEKVTINLLQNAFKYTKEGGSVALIVSASGQNFASRHETHYTVVDCEVPKETLSIVVSDTGVGISRESIQSVFERFYKLNTINHDAHLGTGIGLALVKSLVLLHRGSVTIYSERGKGTDMVIEIPSSPDFYREIGFSLDEQEADPAETAPVLPEQDELPDEWDNPVREVLRRERKQILLAEDNKDLRRLIAESLSAEYDVLEAADGVEAAGLLQRNDVDLIISDILMPRKDGVELCRQVKGSVDTSHIPFMLVTARTGLESQIEGADSGADFYFEKPVDLGLLRRSVANIFQHQHQLKEHYARNYYADSSELTQNQHDNDFLKRFVDLIERTLDRSDMDINTLAGELHMSRSKLYNKVKKLTDRSPVEFIQNYRMRKAARLIIEADMTMREIMSVIGIESQAYFTNSFKREFGMTPTAFAAQNRKPK